MFSEISAQKNATWWNHPEEHHLFDTAMKTSNPEVQIFFS
jgi:hypothetical protein